ncbi:hypothetical protein EJ02DRAFT_429161 [Clathrospora elynae]|uniref:Uncharacterized protein n=1 Tax=Clathrospora elynae TaxID=706981 RepID=A0A6A5S3X1_9PLEO|nr:hypothetical protein EJ02DRAFT_429161 [Clathrospora elynae]
MRTLTSQQAPQHPAVEKLLIVFAQMCVQAYNCSVWSIVEARWKKHVSQEEAKSTTFQEAAGLSKAACEGLEILCFAKLEEYLGQNGIGIDQLEIAFVREQTRVENYPTWSSGLWTDRVAPLFQPSNEQPNWARNTSYVQKVDEVINIIQEQAPSAMTAQLIDLFYTKLRTVCGQYIQAILHYEHGKASTLAKASKHNSHAMQLQRRMASELDAPHGSVGYPPGVMIQKGSDVGKMPSTLEALQEFYSAYKEWVEEETARLVLNR